MLNIADIIPAKYQYISMLTLALAQSSVVLKYCVIELLSQL